MDKRAVEVWVRERLANRLGCCLPETRHEDASVRHTAKQLPGDTILLRDDTSNPLYRVFITAPLKVVVKAVAEHCTAHGLDSLPRGRGECCDLLCAAMCAAHGSEDHEERCSGWCGCLERWHNEGDLE